MKEWRTDAHPLCWAMVVEALSSFTVLRKGRMEGAADDARNVTTPITLIEADLTSEQIKKFIKFLGYNEVKKPEDLERLGFGIEKMDEGYRIFAEQEYFPTPCHEVRPFYYRGQLSSMLNIIEPPPPSDEPFYDN